MNILYDPFCYSEVFGGVSRYFTEVITNLPKDVEYTLPLKVTNNEYYKNINQNYKEFFPNKKFKGQCSLIKQINKFEFNKTIKNCTYDIYHQTHYDTYAYTRLPNNIKKIVTIYDLNYFAIPEFYSDNKKIKQMQIDSIEKSDYIITISENTKTDLIKYFRVPEEKISVIYLGIDKFKNDVIPYKTDKPYILFVGARYTYKNFMNAIKAFKEVNKEKSFYFICTGNQFTNEEKKLLEDLNIVDSVKQIKASDVQLKSLYKGATCFIFPSYYEGFGLPLLEAMFYGAPIICSNTSCFPEIANNAALFFNPYSIDDIKDKMLRVLSDSQLQFQLRQNGYERVSCFSWEKTALEHYKLYKSLLEQ